MICWLSQLLMDWTWLSVHSNGVRVLYAFTPKYMGVDVPRMFLHTGTYPGRGMMWKVHQESAWCMAYGFNDSDHDGPSPDGSSWNMTLHYSYMVIHSLRRLQTYPSRSYDSLPALVILACVTSLCPNNGVSRFYIHEGHCMIHSCHPVISNVTHGCCTSGRTLVCPHMLWDDSSRDHVDSCQINHSIYDVPAYHMRPDMLIRTKILSSISNNSHSQQISIRRGSNSVFIFMAVPLILLIQILYQ